MYLKMQGKYTIPSILLNTKGRLNCLLHHREWSLVFPLAPQKDLKVTETLVHLDHDLQKKNKVAQKSVVYQGTYVLYAVHISCRNIQQTYCAEFTELV